MDVAQSPPMSWEDQVQEEEEEQERHSSTRGDSQPGPSPRHWKVVTLVMSLWLRRVPNNKTLM